MEFEGSLSNQLLIAMPGMPDPNFNSTVTLICEHNADGALGIIINRPMNLKLGGLFSQLDVKATNRRAAQMPVMSGGPVARERGFVLHEPGEEFESSIGISGDVQLTLSRDILDAIATGRGPLKSLIALGYAGWEAGQLESEMLDNTWLSVPASNEVIFDVPFADRWVFAARTLGIDISRVSPHAGHA
ncbi:MAG: YqgE/AlgH family protein [Gammaproteobacteria bacterium]|nr:YqgE/AlgH family protein [Gammaproteobacteria bacterium]MDH4314224.1 YqgE/AlgH family protein [Gammaproteobacteria bacterium]MDH5213255.1 YqgE/AlgH family protein [Gammaproteobacteria bacterium]